MKSFKGMGEGIGLSNFGSISSNAVRESRSVNVGAVRKMKFSDWSFIVTHTCCSAGLKIGIVT